MSGTTVTGLLVANNVCFDQSTRPFSGIVTADGQLLIGSAVAPFIRASTLTAGTGVSITNAAGSITIGLSGGGISIDSIATQSGTSPVTPTGAGLVNISGAGSTTTVGSANTVTVQLTGLTNHAVLVGAGTSTITKLGVGTNGQVLIGATAADPAFATLTSTGGTIAFTTGANTLNLEVVDGGFAWTNVSGTSATMVKENAYQANNAGLVTLTMPSVASSTFGDTIKIGGFGAGGWLIQCVATQLIHFGSSATSAAGSLASTNRYDQVELVCSSTTTEWFVRYAVGNLTVA